MNIVGRLTGDARISTLKDERKVVNFSVAVNDSYKNKEGERIKLTEYYDCSYWLTANIAKYLTKGTLVELAGWVSAKAWASSDGEAKATLSLHTSQIRLLSGNGNSAGQPTNAVQENQQTTADNGDKDDLPF